MVYQWKGRKYAVSADIVGKEVERIEKKQGEVTSKSLVDAARPEKSALHKLFEWDDAKAAESYRLHEAGKILCALSIVREDMPEPTVVRAYMNVADDADNPTRRTGSFVNVQDAFSDPDKRELILRVAVRELREIRQKYEALTELAAVFEAIDRLG